jgi:hypothetical protein
MDKPLEYPDPRHPDMSPEGIAMRLRHVDDLRRLAISLREAGRHPPRPVSLDRDSRKPIGDARVPSSP